jgi:hypothetical protein
MKSSMTLKTEATQVVCEIDVSRNAYESAQILVGVRRVWGIVIQ